MSKLHNELMILERLCNLINRKMTGTAEDLASRLEVSRATAYRYIDFFRDAGVTVTYCKERQSFCFEKTLDFGVFLNDLRGC